jgi:hypothetical protein
MFIIIPAAMNMDVAVLLSAMGMAVFMSQGMQVDVWKCILILSGFKYPDLFAGQPASACVAHDPVIKKFPAKVTFLI